jgi:hypothetical protein
MTEVLIVFLSLSMAWKLRGPPCRQEFDANLKAPLFKTLSHSQLSELRWLTLRPQRTTQKLLDISKEVGMKVNAEKTVFVSLLKNVKENSNKNRANESLHNVLKVKTVKSYGAVLEYAFLTLALDSGEWLASRPGRFTPTESAPVSPWIGSWVGPRFGGVVTVLNFIAMGVEGVVKRKIPSPCQDSNHRSSSLYPSVIPAPIYVRA